MTNIAVVYCSRYGSTKQYAQWLAEDLGADLYDVRRVYKEKLETYDTIVFGGGLYYGVIKGLSRLKRNYASIRESNLVVFAVGLTSPENKKASGQRGARQSFSCHAEESRILLSGRKHRLRQAGTFS